MHISPNLSVSRAIGKCEGSSCASDSVLLQRANNLLLRFAWWRATSAGPAAKIEGGAEASVSRAEATRDEPDGAMCAQELLPQGQALLEKAATMENDGIRQGSELRAGPFFKEITLCMTIRCRLSTWRYAKV